MLHLDLKEIMKFKVEYASKYEDERYYESDEIVIKSTKCKFCDFFVKTILGLTAHQTKKH